jgi:hypothetical protein
MSEFTVVDLLGQAEAIERHVQGWPPDDIMAWLRQFGEVTAVPIRHAQQTVYHFESRCGMPAAFWFTPDGRLTISPRYH